MTMSTECTRLRTLLGVYVLGAIEPAERALVDDHLSDCTRCRDELASLAGLPALLGRVTEEQLTQLGPPPGELFDSILTEAGREGRVRRRRNGGWLVLAAAILVAATGVGVDVVTRGGHNGRPPITAPLSPTPTATGRTLSASDSATGVSAQINIVPKQWGTAFAVHMTGAPYGSRCRLFAIDKSGWSDIAGGWKVEYTGGGTFYGSSMITNDQLASVEIRTTEGERLLRVHP
jgi:hypothetical protein